MDIKPMQIINRKYPFSILNTKHLFLTGIAVSAILYIFQPFGFHSYEKNKIIASLGFGLITLVCLLFSNSLAKKQLHLIFNKKWTILKEIGYILFVLILISASNLYYLSLIVDGFQVGVSSFIYTLSLTSAIGIFPITGIVLIRYNSTLKYNLNKIIQEGRSSEAMQNSAVTFENTNKTEPDFTIGINNFLFLEAIKNHVHIYYLEDGLVKTTSIRNTLTNIEKQVNNDAVFQCHRSFLINLNQIKTAKGNSNGYKIHLKNYEQTIPVSRKYVPEFQKIIY
ncbi:LytTR family DNA-binding domain-containing protein [Labilibaculum sp.]|uniref:LytR/AlgR family response regulator transcription factor n=1 Tax=Labilibaculum sp. TaxID=2060723 RepID=UPI002AA94A29|nr:LytTR family DNA-binding domain-containing protein [Labilibaculum sp.]